MLKFTHVYMLNTGQCVPTPKHVGVVRNVQECLDKFNGCHALGSAVNINQ